MKASLEIKIIPISDIKPYWRNPRKGNVAAVKQSIKDYGYNQPILLDQNNIIVVGHARYKALQELGYTEVACIVANLTEEQAREYRIVDNKTADMSVWDMDNLVAELKTMPDIGKLEGYFNREELNRYINKSIGVDEFRQINSEDIIKSQTELDTKMSNSDEVRRFRPRIVVCPKCGYEFSVSD